MGTAHTTTQVRTPRRRKTGYTLLELIIAVAIIVVMTSIIGINLVLHKRNLDAAEANTVAKEIFVAAQNHLLTAEADSIDLTTYDESGMGHAGTHEDDSEKPTNYFVVSGDAGDSLKNTLLSVMLPFGSIDEYVRSSSKGSYIIRYDRKALRILDVFYAPEAKLGTADYEELMALRGDDHADDRKHYDAKGDGQTNIIVGYYGGVEVAQEVDELEAPTLIVDNGDRLIVRVINSKKNIKGDGSEYNQAATARLRLTISGVTSRASTYIDLAEPGDDDTPVKVAPKTAYLEPTDGLKYTLVLDDITRKGGNFAALTKSETGELCSKVKNADDTPVDFIPGENLRISVAAVYTENFGKVAQSETIQANSLFGTMRPSKGTNNATVRITSMRHLENLDPRVSNLNAETDASSKLDIRAAVQPQNLSWTTFRMKTAYWKIEDGLMQQDGLMQLHNLWKDSGIDADGNYKSLDEVIDTDLDNMTPTEKAAHSSKANNVRVYAWSASSDTDALTTASCYYPVDLLGHAIAGTTGYTFTYDGVGHKISDVRIGASGSAQAGPAGLFTKLMSGTTVKDLRLTNFDIYATGVAGALAGEVEGIAPEEGATDEQKAQALVAINGVSAYNKTTGKDTDAGFAVRGTGNTGGLIGKVAHAQLTNCNASLYVQTTPAEGATAYAGGLVGSASSSSFVGCYAGGHTAADAPYTGGVYLASGPGAGRPNVMTSSGVAGGLVGTLTGGSISSSYSTCSAQGTTSVGGLVGTCSGKINAPCYATGLVIGSATRGALVGTLASGGEISNTGANVSCYLDMVNNPTNDSASPVPAVGSNGGTIQDGSVVAADMVPTDKGALDPAASLERYKATISSGDYNAMPYDRALKTGYLGKYPFKTISELTGDDTYASVHHGDWPDVELLVPNT